MVLWGAFLPWRIMAPTAPGIGRPFTAAVLIIDVCGFTTASEAVARTGISGTERLSSEINAVFAPLVALVHDNGGEVANFLGDAIVAVFGRGEAALRCATAAHEHVGAAANFAISIGVAAGPLVSTVVGQPRERLEHVLIGAPLARAAGAERAAGAGRTVASPEVSGFMGELPPAADGVDAARFLHRSVAARVRAGRAPLLAEHRRVSSLFCRFEDLGAQDPAAPARLQQIVVAAMDVIRQFDGALLQVELVDKGSSLKATFGAPVAHEDDARRAIACAHALLARPEFGTAAIGISSGAVLCGLIGSAARREYTVLGDAVNVAARLMRRAGAGRVLVDEPSRVAAATAWAWEPAGSFALRGRVAPVTVFTTRGEGVPEPRQERPLVGRQEELERLHVLLDQRSGVMSITGEPGIGKSRLLTAVTAEARARNLALLQGAGQPYGRDVAYGAWHPFASKLVGGGGEDAALVAPLLGKLADERPPSALRVEALHHLVMQRLEQCAPVLLAFEDLHWFDEPSRALLERVAHEHVRLGVHVVVTSRSGALAEAVELAVDGLAPEALARVVNDGEALAAETVEAVVVRSGGNPLFAEELAAFVQEHGRLDDLPDTLRAVVTARLDALEEHQRAVLRIASVIGPTFEPEWLWRCDASLGGQAAVDHALTALARHGIVHRAGARLTFKHAVTREVAYDTLALAAREFLHSSVARYVEATRDLERADVLDLLAHHYAHTTDIGKQRTYLRRAGDAARAAFANEAATRHYRALAPLLSGVAQLEVALDLGAVLQHAGDWQAAEAVYADTLTSAERLRSEPVAAQARAALGGLHAYNRASPEAVGELEAARASFARLDDRERLAAVLEPLAHAYFQQGDLERAGDHAREHLRLAVELGDRAAESTALDTLGLVSWQRGEWEAARTQLEAALEIARDDDDRPGIVHRLNDLAGLLAELSHPRGALARLAEAYELARATGYRRLAGVVIGNAAELFKQSGDDAAALACARAALEGAVALGDVVELLHSAVVVAEVRRRQGHAAERLLALVVEVARAAGHQAYLEEAQQLRATGATAPPARVTLDATAFVGADAAPDPDALTAAAATALAAWLASEPVK